MKASRGRTWRRRKILIVAGATILSAASPSHSHVDWSKAQHIDVAMVEYRFVPDRLTFRVGIPYRLHLNNRGQELHEFTAPEFFQTVTLRNSRVLWTGGEEVVVQPGASVDVDLVPRQSGRFDLRCADHDWAGMTGEIIVH